MPHLDALLTAPEFFENPYPAYHQLREQAPVYWCATWNAWVLTRHADVQAIQRDPRVFSSRGRVAAQLDRLPEPARSQVDLLRRHYAVGITHSDPPDHTRLRALVTRSFAPALIESMRPKFEALTAELIEQIDITRPFDVMAALAYPLPATVIAEMLGAPASDRDLLRKWAFDVNNLHARPGQPDPDIFLATQRGLADFRAYLADLIAEHQRHPRNDVLSALIEARDQGDRLSEEELVSSCVTLFVAGHETTTHALCNGLIALLRHPDQLERLRAAPERLPLAFEEMLRYDTSVQRSARRITEDVEIGGQRLRAGQIVLGMIGAANRDPAVFSEPDRFNPDRADLKHTSFGYGIHFCLGAPLARMEAPIALRALLTRAPGLAFDVSHPLQWRRDVALRGVDALWVTG
ncbi:MAG: cytochrome P450 [Thermoflexales bacterium]|nr:cytochrome P450 [Thermoflexales bacterium]